MLSFPESKGEENHSLSDEELAIHREMPSSCKKVPQPPEEERKFDGEENVDCSSEEAASPIKPKMQDDPPLTFQKPKQVLHRQSSVSCIAPRQPLVGSFSDLKQFLNLCETITTTWPTLKPQDLHRLI